MTITPQPTVHLGVCRRCHQPNLMPVEAFATERHLCYRCGSSLRPWSRSLHNNRLAAVFAVAGLAFYVPAMSLPLMGVRRFGFTNDVGLIEGVTSLMHHGNFLLGVLVLFCSVFLPLGKLLGLLLLSTRGLSFGEHRRSAVFHFIELTGRFSVLDVLLVAVLIAVVKVGDLVTVHMGPGLIAFALLVAFSLLAAWAFDPNSIWEAGHERQQ